MHGISLLAGMAFLAGCASVHPPAVTPGTGTLWGYVRVVPREGVTPGKKDESTYADRRMRDVQFVDYSRPGFAVVYLEGAPPPSGTGRVAIQPSLFGPRFDPRYSVIGAGATLTLRNSDRVAHTVSCPPASLVRTLAPGDEVAIPSSAAGALPLFLLDTPDVEATIFVSPGPYTVVSDDGRWELRDVGPGKLRLEAWHPRFPPTAREIDVTPNVAQHVDLQLGVGNLETHAEIH